MDSDIRNELDDLRRRVAELEAIIGPQGRNIHEIADAQMTQASAETADLYQHNPAVAR